MPVAVIHPREGSGLTDEDLRAFLEAAHRRRSRSRRGSSSSTSRCRGSAPARSTASPSRRSTAVETRRSPVREARPDRRAADQPRHARRARGSGGAALPRRIPVRPARDRNPAPRLAADPARHHPAHPAEEVGACLQPGLDRGRLAARRDHARGRREALQERLGDDVIVDFAMRYGNPGIAASIDAADRRRAATRILVAPLYPQYCAATTATAIDAVFAALAAMRWQPALRTLPPYYDDPLYIDALKASLERQLAALDFEPRAAAAQLPRHAAADAGARRPLSLPLPEDRAAARRSSSASPIDVAFQSRFGRAKWLEPATDTMLAAYPAQGVTRIAIAAPGFSADCLETLEELGIRGRETFLAAGGNAFRAARLPQRSAPKAWRCSTRSIAPRTCRMVAAGLSRPHNREQERDSWHAWQSSPAARAASARRSASRSRTWE